MLPDLDARLDGGRLCARRSRFSAPSPSPSGRRCALRQHAAAAVSRRSASREWCRARSRLTHGLVVLQLALSVLLLTSAGLAHRSLSLQRQRRCRIRHERHPARPRSTRQPAVPGAGGQRAFCSKRCSSEARAAAWRRARLVRAGTTGVGAGLTFPCGGKAPPKTVLTVGQSRRFRVFRHARRAVRCRNATSRRSRRRDRGGVVDHHAAAGRRRLWPARVRGRQDAACRSRRSIGPKRR